nr:hypothetical protein [Methanobacterium formicicum]
MSFQEKSLQWFPTKLRTNLQHLLVFGIFFVLFAITFVLPNTSIPVGTNLFGAALGLLTLLFAIEIYIHREDSQKNSGSLSSSGTGVITVGCCNQIKPD